MADVDPRNFMDFYRLKVQLSVIAETSMTRDDFDPEEHAVIYSTQTIDDELYVDFTSEQGAEKLIDDWNYSLDAIRRGALSIRSTSLKDRPEVDGLLIFHPKKKG
jgi:hypothetical protein